jgi:hypothetical protein
MPESLQAWSRRLWNGFKLTIEKWLAVQAAQNNKCAICEQPEEPNRKTGKLRRLATDHSWVNGEFRGLLCRRCNTLLGRLERGGRSGKPWTLDELKAAVNYKEHPPARDVLGYIHIGYPGSVSTKAHRKRLKREAKAQKATENFFE